MENVNVLIHKQSNLDSILNFNPLKKEDKSKLINGKFIGNQNLWNNSQNESPSLLFNNVFIESSKASSQFQNNKLFSNLSSKDKLLFNALSDKIDLFKKKNLEMGNNSKEKEALLALLFSFYIDSNASKSRNVLETLDHSNNKLNKESNFSNELMDQFKNWLKDSMDVLFKNKQGSFQDFKESLFIHLKDLKSSNNQSDTYLLDVVESYVLKFMLLSKLKDNNFHLKDLNASNLNGLQDFDFSFFSSKEDFKDFFLKKIAANLDPELVKSLYINFEKNFSEHNFKKNELLELENSKMVNFSKEMNWSSLKDFQNQFKNSSYQKDLSHASYKLNTLSTQETGVSFLDQVIKNIKFINKSKDYQEFNIALKPDFLGKLLIKISNENGFYRANVFVDNIYLKNHFESQINELRHQFNELGIELESFDVLFIEDFKNKENLKSNLDNNPDNMLESDFNREQKAFLNFSEIRTESLNENYNFDDLDEEKNKNLLKEDIAYINMLV